MRQVFLLGAMWAVLLGAASAHARADVGTCLTAAGVRVAPWTDDHDPACGADCGADGRDSEALDERCDEQCGDEPEWAMPAPRPEPEPGPRCLTAGASCEPGAPAPGFESWMAGAGATAPPDLPPLRRAPGTLPGPGPVGFSSRPLDSDRTPPTPPPRVGLV